MPDTMFTQPPHWEWLIILYFFIGGIASGAYVIALAADVMGTERDREVARIGYFVAFPLVIVAALLLIADLGQPARFWHMLIASNTGGIVFKYWSPMSLGSWALLVFGAFTFVSFVGGLAEVGVLPALRWVAGIPRSRPLGLLFALAGGLVGFFIAGYTGILLSVTNQPIWADSQMLGALFLASAASTALALMLLLAAQRHGGHLLLGLLEEVDNWVLGIELVVLVLFLGTLGSLAGKFIFSLWGGLLILGVGVAGILVPLVIHLGLRRAALLSSSFAALLALIGGFLLRYAVIMGGQSL